jgi:formate hydrogenlyase subunit 6/NADH:ubiquinone oxidoreductase subunit I
LKGNGKVLVEGGTVGFIFPVYFARPPAILQEFIAGADFKDTAYCFAVANGGGLFGKVLKIFEKALGKKGIPLDSGFIVCMPGIHPRIASLLKKSSADYYQQEAIKVEEIVRIVGSQGAYKVETNYGLFGNIFSYLAFRTPYKLSKAHLLDKDLWVNDECDNCGICERVCPVDNIELDNSKSPGPTWRHRCINCLACYHHCPQEAIQLGSEKPMKRYRHPDIDLAEIIARNRG